MFYGCFFRTFETTGPGWEATEPESLTMKYEDEISKAMRYDVPTMPERWRPAKKKSTPITKRMAQQWLRRRLTEGSTEAARELGTTDNAMRYACRRYKLEVPVLPAAVALAARKRRLAGRGR